MVETKRNLKSLRAATAGIGAPAKRAAAVMPTFSPAFPAIYRHFGHFTAQKEEVSEKSKKILKKSKKVLAFFETMCYYIQALDRAHMRR